MTNYMNSTHIGGVKVAMSAYIYIAPLPITNLVLASHSSGVIALCIVTQTSLTYDKNLLLHSL